MAWSFNGSTGYLTAATAPVASPPLTIACWFRKSGTASSFKEVVTLANPSTGHEFALLAGNGAAAAASAFALGGTGAQASSTTTFALAQWRHGAAVFASGNQRYAYLDGGGKGTNSVSVTPASINRTDVGRGIVGYFPGDVAEVAVWNAALSDLEIAALAQGFSPLCLLHRLANLVLYQNLIRPLNHPGIGPLMSAAGGATAATHPRMIHPRSLAFGPLRRQVQLLNFYRVAAAQARATAVQQGWAAVSGTEMGSSYPVGEVSN